MKITTERKSLADTITWVAQALPRQANTPALAGIRLRAEHGRLTLSAFDYDVSHQARVAVEVIDDGECLVPGAFLRSIVSALAGKAVELSLDGNLLTITSGRSTYRTQVLSLAEYPNLPTPPDALGTVDGDALAAAVNDCLGAVDQNAPLPVLLGLRLEASQGTLDVVSASSPFVAHCSLDWEGGDLSATIPAGTLRAAASGLVGAVAIGCTGSAVGLSDAERTVTLRTIEDEFPKWRRMMRAATDDAFEVIADRDELASAIKRSSALAKTATGAGLVRLVIEPDSVEIVASDDHASGSDVIEAEAGGTESIQFGHEHLIKALAAMPTGPVRLGIGARRSATQAGFMSIRPNSDDGGREAMVAPRRELV